MADYDAKIRVSADTKQAESELSKLQKKLNDLSSVASKINTGSVESGIKNVANVAKNVGTEVKNIFSRGLFAGAVLGAGQLSTSISSAASNLGPFTGAVKAAGAAFSSSLGGVPAIVGNILDQVGQIPNALGLAAVAAVAFAPQLLKASSAAVGLGAAIDTAVGKQATNAIADTVSKFGLLNTEINTVKTSFQDLIKGSSLNQLNAQLQDAKLQAGAYVSTTEEAVIAANQLAAVLREQRAEQQAITDLARVAQGLRPQSVENRATNTYNVFQRRKNLFNAEVEEYNRLAEIAAANTKAWQDKIDLLNKTAAAGPLGTKSQLSTRLQEFLRNKQSAQIAREASAAALAKEEALAGAPLPLSVLPAGKTLSPGGNTLTAQSQYRDLLNQTATIQNAVAAAVERTGKSQRQLEISSIATTKSSTQQLKIKQEQNRIDEQSVAIARARNAELAKELGIEINIGKTAEVNNKTKQKGAGLANGAVGNAIIGGAFPLLFGQGIGASVGGGLGGAAGGILGGTFGFGLSLVGTVIGTALDESENLNKELVKLNINVKGVGTSAESVDRLASSLGIAKDEAVKLLSQFTQFDSAKVRETLAGIFGGGFEQAFQALEQVTKEKNVLDAIVQTRTLIGNKKANELVTQLKINGEAAAELGLQEAILRLSEKRTIEELKRVTLQDRLIAGLAAIGGQLVDPSIFGQERGAKQQAQFDKDRKERLEIIQRSIRESQAFFARVDALNQQYSEQGRKGPEDRTVSLKADLQAVVDTVDAENKLRDLRFQGLDAEAVRFELLKTTADIERDRVKQLENANFQTERETINQIALARTIGARLVAEDVLRDVANKRFQEELQAQQAVRDSVKPIKDFTEQQKVQAQFAKTYSRLVNEGLLPAEAERIANFEKLVAEQKSAVAEQIKVTELALIEAKARGASTIELEKQLQTFKNQQTAIQDQAALGPGAGLSIQDRLNAEAATIRGRLNELLDPANQIKSAADSISTAFSQSFKDIITGATSAQEALANFFNSIASSFADLAADLIKEYLKLQIIGIIKNFFPGGSVLGSLPGTTGLGTNFSSAIGNDTGIPFLAGIGTRASGGPVSAGSPYLVGEKGPELFMPRNSGTIIPNNAMGGGSTNVVVNVDASGSSVQGDQQQAKQLGLAVSAAVQAELVKQQRPGGLLAGTRR